MITALLTAALVAVTTSAWTAAAPLSTPRAGHTATLLPDGRVLVTGGTAGAETATAEIYDPHADAWTATAPMAEARRNHSATLLRDGTVLVVGGFRTVAGVNTYLASAETYDPTAGAWRAAAPLQAARAYHSATLLGDGRVVVAGGASLGDLDSTEVYDPVQATWSTAGKLSVRRYDHAAVPLADGTVLVLGGYSSKLSSSTCTAVVERFDPATATWSTVGQLLADRAQTAAALLPDGRVLLAGGQGTAGDLDAVEIFDPRAGTSAAAAPLTAPRRAGAATVVSDGHVVVTGGYAADAYGNSAWALTAEVYDPAAGAWARAGALAHGRFFHTATRLQDGRVLVAGGFDDAGPLATAELGSADTSVRAATGGGCSSIGVSGGAGLACVLLLLARRSRRIPLRADIGRAA